MSEAVPIAIVGIFFATLWLSAYTYAMYQLGRKLANRYRLRVTLPLAATSIALASIGLAMPVMLFSWTLFVKVLVGFGIWLLHAQSTFLGYWSGVENGRKQDERRWQENANAWINSFEESQLPVWMQDKE